MILTPLSITKAEDSDGASLTASFFGKDLVEFQSLGELFGKLRNALSKYKSSAHDASEATEELASTGEETNAVQEVSQNLVENVNESLQENSDALQNNAEQIQNNAEQTASSQAATQAATNSQKKFSVALVASKVAATALNMAVSTLATMGISALIQFIIGVFNAEKDLQNAAEELGKSISDTTSSIDEYKTKIEELYVTINDNSSSISEVTEARERLMEIQDEMIDKYGTEKEAIQNITDAINGQTGALDELSKRSYFEYKNEFNKETAGDRIGSFFHGYFGESKSDHVVSEMERKDHGYSLDTTGNDALDKSIMDILGMDSLDFDNSKIMSVTGSLEEIQDKLYEIQKLTNGFDVSNNFEKSFNYAVTDVDNLLSKYQEYYDQYILFEKILSDNPDNNYDEQFDSINKAKEAYDEAFKSGDQSSINAAKENYSKILHEAMQAAIDSGDEGVADYFRDMFPELQAEISSYEFELNLTANKDGLKESIDKALETLNGYSVEKLKALDANPEIINGDNDISDAYSSLKNAAISNNMSYDQLIDELEKRSLVFTEAYKQLVDQFGKDNIEELTPEKLNIAYSLENVGDMTFDELKREISNIQMQQNIVDPSTISQSISQISKQLKPQFDALADAYQNIFTDDGFTLDNVDTEMLENLRSAFEDIEEDLNVDFNTSEMEKFFKVLTNGNSTAKQVQDAFNNLANSYLYSTDTLENLNDETANAIEQQLEEMGVTNANEVVTAALSAKNDELAVTKMFLAETSNDLANASSNEIAAFGAEQAELGRLTQNMALLLIQKIQNNLTSINTSTDIDNLYKLAKAAGATTETLNILASAKSRFTTNSTGDAFVDSHRAQKDIALGIKHAPELDVSYEPPKIDFDGNSIKEAKKAGKEAADKYLEAFEKELKELDDLRDSGLISEKEYLDRLRVLYNRYFKDKKKYVKEYAKYERQYLEGMKSLYESVFSHASKLIGDRIDKLNDEKDAAVKSYEDQKEAAEEMYQAQIDAIDEEISRLEDKKEANDKIIDGLQDEIDKIREAKEERQRDLDLQKAQYNLERMQNQRTQLVYNSNNGYIYRPDTSGIRDAKNELEDAKDEIYIAGIEKQIKAYEDANDRIDETIDRLNKQKESIESMIDSSNEYYDSQISAMEEYYDSMVKALEEYQSRWDELSELQEHAEMIGLLQELGYTEEDLLNMSSGALENFRQTYYSILKDMNAGNQGILDGLSQLTNIDMSSIPGYLQQTQEYIDSISNMDVTALTNSIDAVKDSLDGVSQSAGSAASSISGEGATSSTSGSGDKKEGESSSSSIVGASETVKEKSVPALNEVSSALASGDEEDSGASVESSAHKAASAISAGENSKSKGSEEEANDLQTAVTQQTEAALDEETGVPAQIAIFQELNDVLSTILNNIKLIKEEMSSFSNGEFNFGMSGSGSAHAKGIKYSRGEKNALVSEYNQPEMTIYPDGHYEVTTEPTLRDLPPGTKVLNEAQTKKVLRSKGNAYASGKDNFVPISSIDPDKYKMLMAFSNMDESLIQNSYALDDMTKQLRELCGSSASAISNIKNQDSSASVSIAEIHLHEVQNVDSLADAIQRELPSKMLQRIHKK